MIFGIKEKLITLTHKCIIGYCYKYTRATYDWVCAPESHILHIILFFPSINCYKVINFFNFLSLYMKVYSCLVNFRMRMIIFVGLCHQKDWNPLKWAIHNTHTTLFFTVNGPGPPQWQRDDGPAHKHSASAWPRRLSKELFSLWRSEREKKWKHSVSRKAGREEGGFGKLGESSVFLFQSPSLSRSALSCSQSRPKHFLSGSVTFKHTCCF